MLCILNTDCKKLFYYYLYIIHRCYIILCLVKRQIYLSTHYNYSLFHLSIQSNFFCNKLFFVCSKWQLPNLLGSFLQVDFSKYHGRFITIFGKGISTHRREITPGKKLPQKLFIYFYFLPQIKNVVGKSTPPPPPKETNVFDVY